MMSIRSVRINIAVTDPNVARFIEESVKQGKFRSAEAVVVAGVARLMLDEEPDAPSLAVIDEGLAQIARGEDRDFEEFAAEFRKHRLGK